MRVHKQNLKFIFLFILVILVIGGGCSKNPSSADDDEINLSVTLSPLTQTNGPFSGDIQTCIIKGNGDLMISTFQNGIYESNDNGDTWIQVVNKPGFSAIVTCSDGTQWAVAAPQSPVKGIFKSEDNGATWSASNTNWVTGNSIVVDAVDNIYVASGNAILKSVNSGASWSELPKGVFEEYICDFVINSAGDIFVITCGGLFRLLAGDNTWLNLTQGLSEETIHSIAINSRDEIFAGSEGEGIFRSMDNGDSWQQINNGFSSHIGYFIKIDNMDNIYVGAYGDAFWSDNNGNQWQSLGLKIGWGCVTTIAINPDNDIFLGSQYYGMFRSTDGINWQQINNGIINSTVKCLAIASDKMVFAGTYGGLFVSTNGYDWLKCCFQTTQTNSADVYDPAVKNILFNPANGSIFIVANGLYRSVDYGASWSLVKTGYIPVVAINSALEIFVAGSYSGLFRSNNDGLSWQTVGDGLDSNPIGAIGIGQNDEMFAATVSLSSVPAESHLFYSDDRGSNWKQTGVANMNIIAIEVNEAGNIFVVDNLEGVYYSKDKGKSWTKRSEGLTYTTSLKMDDQGILYAGTLFGAFVSGDYGKTWNPVDSDVSELRILSVALDNQDNLYVGTDGKGVFKASILK